MSKLLAKYRDEQADVAREAMLIVDRCESEGREPTDDEAKELETLQAENNRLKSLIERAEHRQNLVRNMAPVRDGNQNAEREAQRRANETKWSSIGEFLHAVANAEQNFNARDPRLQFTAGVPSGLGERIPSDGGFLVGMDLATELMDSTYQLSRIAPLCRMTEIGPNSNGLRTIHVDETSRVDGSRYGGILAYWHGEADTLAESKPKFRTTEQRLEKLTGLMYVTDELLEDAVALDSEVRNLVPEEFAFKLDDAILRGTGAGQPKGIFNATDLLVTVSKESAQTAATINGENVKKMFARMWPSGLSRAVWIINQDCWPQMFSLREASTTTSQQILKFSDSPMEQLFGRPILPVEQCSTLGTVGDIAFLDFSQYKLIRKRGMRTDTSMHVRFLQQEQVYRWTMRVNGQPIRQKSLTPYKGSNTISPFVVLETRS